MARFDVARAPELIRRARADADLTQVELAERAGLQQPSLAQMESGKRTMTEAMLERVLRAADYRPSLPLADNAAVIADAASRRGLADVRVFGSATRGEDSFESDIDLVVTPGPDSDLFDLALFADDVRRITGFPADVVSDTSEALADVLAGAVPL